MTQKYIRINAQGNYSLHLDDSTGEQLYTTVNLHIILVLQASKMLIYLYILCMYILSILIVMGEQFPKTKSEIRFGWGISYNYIGQLHQNLNKYDVVVGLKIPDFRTVAYYAPISTDPQYCCK